MGFGFSPGFVISSSRRLFSPLSPIAAGTSLYTIFSTIFQTIFSSTTTTGTSLITIFYTSTIFCTSTTFGCIFSSCLAVTTGSGLSSYLGFSSYWGFDLLWLVWSRKNVSSSTVSLRAGMGMQSNATTCFAIPTRSFLNKFSGSSLFSFYFMVSLRCRVCLTAVDILRVSRIITCESALTSGCTMRSIIFSIAVIHAHFSSLFLADMCRFTSGLSTLRMKGLLYWSLQQDLMVSTSRRGMISVGFLYCPLPEKLQRWVLVRTIQRSFHSLRWRDLLMRLPSFTLLSRTSFSIFSLLGAESKFIVFCVLIQAQPQSSFNLKHFSYLTINPFNPTIYPTRAKQYVQLRLVLQIQPTKQVVSGCKLKQTDETMILKSLI